MRDPRLWQEFFQPLSSKRRLKIMIILRSPLGSCLLRIKADTSLPPTPSPPSALVIVIVCVDLVVQAN